MFNKSNYNLISTQKSLAINYFACVDSENTINTFYKCTWLWVRNSLKQKNKTITFRILSFIKLSVLWGQSKRMMKSCLLCVMVGFYVLTLRKKKKRWRTKMMITKSHQHHNLTMKMKTTKNKPSPQSPRSPHTHSH